MQIHMASFTFAIDLGMRLASYNMNLMDKSFDYMIPHYYKDGAMIIATLNRPRSRGYIKLRDNNPFSHPEINPRYFSDDHDLKAFMGGMKLCMKVANSQAFKAIGAKPWGKEGDPFCGSLEDDTEWLECFIKTWSTTVYHPVGTAAMGMVTTATLNVRGLEGIRVADASVMPVIVGGNTN